MELPRALPGGAPTPHNLPLKRPLLILGPHAFPKRVLGGGALRSFSYQDSRLVRVWQELCCEVDNPKTGIETQVIFQLEVLL